MTGPEDQIFMLGLDWTSGGEESSTLIGTTVGLSAVVAIGATDAHAFAVPSYLET